MRTIKNSEYFVTILRALETVVIFALMGLVIYSLFAGLKVEEVREHYRTSKANEEKILEILQKQNQTQHDVDIIKDEVAPGK